MSSCVFTELTEICKSASQKSVLVRIIHVGYLLCESPFLMKDLCHKMAPSLDHFCHQEIGTRSQAKRNKAANHKTTMHCLYFLM